MFLQVCAWGTNILNLLGQWDVSRISTMLLLTLNAAVQHAGYGRHSPSPPGPGEITWLKYLYAFSLDFALAQIANKMSM